MLDENGINHGRKCDNYMVCDGCYACYRTFGECFDVFGTPDGVLGTCRECEEIKEIVQSRTLWHGESGSCYTYMKHCDDCYREYN